LSSVAAVDTVAAEKGISGSGVARRALLRDLRRLQGAGVAA